MAKVFRENSGNASLVGDERWELVQRIVETLPFQRSLRLRSFLLYICERSLLGREEDIHEAQIGCEVFGKEAGYNPGDDNVVRVTARLLRKRLAEYFDGPGKDEQLRLAIPTGRYIPVFEPRDAASFIMEMSAEEPLSVSEGEPVETVSQQPQASPHTRNLLISYGISALLGVTCAVLLWQNLALRKAVAPFSGRMNPVLGALFESERPTKIVVSDSTYSLAHDLVGAHGSLYQYIDSFQRSLLDVPRPGNINEVIHQVLRRRYTSSADLNTVVRLMQAAAPYWQNTRVFFARDVAARDLKGANVILIGSRRSNPWVEMFEERLNFRYERDDASGQSRFENRAPRAGELASYLNDRGQYAQVALVPNIEDSGRVLILAGANNAGTEAVGEFITNSDQIASFMNKLRLKDGDNPAQFEALIRLNSIAGIPKESIVVAFRSKTR